MDCGFLGQVDGAGLLVDMSHSFNAVALEILAVLQKKSRTGKTEKK